MPKTTKGRTRASPKTAIANVSRQLLASGATRKEVALAKRGLKAVVAASVSLASTTDTQEDSAAVLESQPSGWKSFLRLTGTKLAEIGSSALNAVGRGVKWVAENQELHAFLRDALTKLLSLSRQAVSVVGHSSIKGIKAATTLIKNIDFVFLAMTLVITVKRVVCIVGSSWPFWRLLLSAPGTWLSEFIGNILGVGLGSAVVYSGQVLTSIGSSIASTGLSLMTKALAGILSILLGPLMVKDILSSCGEGGSLPVVLANPGPF